MQILVAVNTDPCSNHAIDQVARLAANTIAKVTILGVGADEHPLTKQPTVLPEDHEPDDQLHRAIGDYRNRFIGQFPRAIDVPFDSGLPAPDIRIRAGNASKAILAESREQESDLIVLGCDDANGSTQRKGQNVPRQIAREADCSVYIAKKARRMDRVVCCLGHEEISQQSLEMVSQFVTLYGARLLMVGLLERGALKSNIEENSAG